MGLSQLHAVAITEYNIKTTQTMFTAQNNDTRVFEKRSASGGGGNTLSS